MPSPTDRIEAAWCYGHQRWYVKDCPGCETERVQRIAQLEVGQLQLQIKELKVKNRELRKENRDGTN